MFYESRLLFDWKCSDKTSSYIPQKCTPFIRSWSYIVDTKILQEKEIEDVNKIVTVQCCAHCFVHLNHDTYFSMLKAHKTEVSKQQQILQYCHLETCVVASRNCQLLTWTISWNDSGERS